MGFLWATFAILGQLAHVATATSLVLPNTTQVTVTLSVPANAGNIGVSNTTLASGANTTINIPQASELKIEAPMFTPLFIPFPQSVALTVVVHPNSVANLIVVYNQTTPTPAPTPTTTPATPTPAPTPSPTPAPANTASVVSGNLALAGQFSNAVPVATYCNGVRKGMAGMLNIPQNSVQLSNCRLVKRRLSEENEGRRLQTSSSLSTDYAVTIVAGQKSADGSSTLNAGNVANKMTVMANPTSSAFATFSNGFVASVKQSNPSASVSVSGATSTANVQTITVTTTKAPENFATNSRFSFGVVLAMLLCLWH